MPEQPTYVCILYTNPHPRPFVDNVHQLFGLLITTFLTLMVVPTLYFLLERGKVRAYRVVEGLFSA